MQLPADRLFAGRTDVLLLVVDSTGLDVRFEPGMPYDPPEMRFPHAYGTVPTSAVVAGAAVSAQVGRHVPAAGPAPDRGGAGPARSEGSGPTPATVFRPSGSRA